jgi:hypothetical protein
LAVSWGGNTGGSYAGYFVGDVNIDGDLTVSGSFPSDSRWTLSGTNLYPDNTGWNVGIGLTSPAYKLHVGGSARINSYLGVGVNPSSTYRIYATGASYGIRAHGSTMGGRFEDSNGTSRTYVAYGNYGIYQNNGSQNYFGGDVGIGTTTPSSKLEVDGWIGRTAHNNGAFVGSYNNVGSNSSNTNPIYVIGANYKPTTTVLNNMYGIGYTHTNAGFILTTGGWGQYVAADGDARIFLGASSGADSYFNAGDVGIGTTSPSEKLHVHGGSVYAHSNNGEWCELADNVWEGSYAHSDSDDGAQGYTTSQYYSGVRGDGPGYMEIDRYFLGDTYYYSEGGTYGRGFESWGSGGSYDEKGGTGVFADGTNTGIVAFGDDIDYWKGKNMSLQSLFSDGYSTGTGIAALASIGARISGTQFGILTNSDGIGLIAHSNNNVSAYFTENTLSENGYAQILTDQNGQSEFAYSVMSKGQQIIISGSSDFVNGEAEVNIDPLLTNIIENDINVSITPSEMPDDFYAVSDKSSQGFIANCNGSDFSFDYIIIAPLKSDTEIPDEMLSEDFRKMLKSAINFEIVKQKTDLDGKSELFTKEERDQWTENHLEQPESEQEDTEQIME